MFGRRNADSFPTPPTKPNEERVDLDMLPDLPDLSGAPAAPVSDVPPVKSEWDVEQAEVLNFQTNVPAPTPFVPTPPVSPAPFSAAAPARPKSAAESVIGPDDFFDGNYRSERGVRLQGTVRGSIESRQYILVESGARVEANLSAEDITVSGDFNGTIDCRHRLEVTSSGRVHGQITTALLVVQEGGVLDGELHMRQEGETPTP